MSEKPHQDARRAARSIHTYPIARGGDGGQATQPLVERFVLELVRDPQGAIAGVRTRSLRANAQAAGAEEHAPAVLLARLHGYSKSETPAQADLEQVIAVGQVEDTPGTDQLQAMLDAAAPGRHAVWDPFLRSMALRILEIAPSNDVDVKPASFDGHFVTFEARDALELELQGAIDLSQRAAAAGMPIPCQVLRDGRIVAPWTQRGQCVAKIDPLDMAQALPVGEEAVAAAENVQNVEKIRQAALKALQRAFPDPSTTFFSLADFLAKTDSETPWRYGRSLYKYTDCGPWTSFIVPGRGERGSVYYETKEADEPQATWWSQCTGILIGSIVEGSDAEVQPETLLWPFTAEQLDLAVKNIDEEAGRLWEEANGEEEGEDESGDAGERDR